MKVQSYFIILLLLTLIYSCDTHHRWTEKEKNDFAEKCSKTDTCYGLTFAFSGYEFSEIENVLVRQMHNKKVIDSFSVFPDKVRIDKMRNRYFVSTDRKLYLRDTFQFIVKGLDTFNLTDMKMIMWSQYTMYAENYGCVMGDYKIDGVRFEHSTNPNFIKK